MVLSLPIFVSSNLVRTRLQAQGTPAHPQTYTGVKDAAYKCFQREGWRGFYKGLTPTLVKVVPAVAISCEFRILGLVEAANVSTDGEHTVRRRCL